MTPGSALVAYEYIITIWQEVEAVWKRPMSATSILLISIRWLMLLTQATAWRNISPNVCAIIQEIAYS